MSAEHAAHHAGPGDAHGGHHDASHYWRIWGVLCVLLGFSIAGPMLEIPLVTLLTAFGIAFIKAWLVIKHFMHLPDEHPVIWYILVTSIAFMGLFFFAVSVDVMNHDGARWSNDAAKAAVVRGMAYGDPADHHVGGHGDAHAAAGGEHAPEAAHAPAGEGH